MITGDALLTGLFKLFSSFVPLCLYYGTIPSTFSSQFYAFPKTPNRSQCYHVHGHQDVLNAGIHVASEVHMLTKERVISLSDRSGVLQWVADHDTVVGPFRPDEVPALAANYDLCITGPVCDCAACSLLFTRPAA